MNHTGKPAVRAQTVLNCRPKRPIFFIADGYNGTPGIGALDTAQTQAQHVSN